MNPLLASDTEVQQLQHNATPEGYNTEVYIVLTMKGIMGVTNAQIRNAQSLVSMMKPYQQRPARQ